MLIRENGERTYQLPARSRRVLIGVLLLVLGVVGALWWNATLNQRAADRAPDQADARSAKLATANETLQRQTAAIIKANQRLRAAGEKPVKVPPTSAQIGPTGPAGQRGPVPTQAEVLAAVTIYCSGGLCASHGPNQSQVTAAVAAYCAARGQCRGPQGSVGPVGAPGAPGATGTPGADATDAQVTSAVDAYCDAHDQCQGPKGETGDQGPAGTARAGSYTCPDSAPYVHGFTVAGDGDVSLDCVVLPIGP